MNQDLFSFEVLGAFPIVLEEPETEFAPLMIDVENATLIVDSGDGDISTFPLVSETGEPLHVGVFLAQIDGAMVIQIGNVTFLRMPLFVQSFPLNESEFNSALQMDHDSGHIGIIDIRDLRTKKQIDYYLDQLPVSFHLENNYLVVSTVRRMDADQGPLWYKVIHQGNDD